MATTDADLPPPLKDTADRLRTQALAFPEIVEEFPLGHSALNVAGKSFLFLAADDGWLKLSMKLPRSREFALAYPFTDPTGYGLGSAGWVTGRFDGDAEVPLEVLSAWIEESVNTIAPKRLVGTL